MFFSLQFYLRLFATIFILVATLVFFKTIAINTALSLIVLAGVITLFFGFKYSSHSQDLEFSIKLALLIPVVIFILWFFYILAQITVALYIITVISFCIIQDGVFRLTTQYFENETFDFTDKYQSIWYGIGMIGIILPAIITFDYSNYHNLANASVLEYVKNNSSQITVYDIANFGNYLENSWLNIQDLAKKTTIGIMQGLLKTSFIAFAIFNFLNCAIKLVLTN